MQTLVFFSCIVCLIIFTVNSFLSTMINNKKKEQKNKSCKWCKLGISKFEMFFRKISFFTVEVKLLFFSKIWWRQIFLSPIKTFHTAIHLVSQLLNSRNENMIITIIVIINLLLASTKSFTIKKIIYTFSSNVADVIIQTRDLKHLKLQKVFKAKQNIKKLQLHFYTGHTVETILRKHWSFRCSFTDS